MRTALWATSALAVVLCGTASLTNGAGTVSAIDFIRGLQARTSDPQLRPLVKVNNDIKRKDGYRTFAGWWCPSEAGVNNTDDVRTKIIEFCQSNGGVFEGSLCRSANDTAGVLFMVQFNSTSKCGKNPTADVFIAEATTQPPTAEFMALLEKYGHSSLAKAQ